MSRWFDLDWQGMFVPSQHPLETVIRGSVTYLAVFTLLRVFRRQTGSVGPADLLVLLLVADASQNAMAGQYRSITDGLVLIATIVSWEYAIDWLGFYVPSVSRFLERQPLLVIENGRVHQENLRKELMTEDELLSQLRQKGVADPSGVKQSFIEGDGRISVITDGRATPAQSRPPESGTAG